MKVSVLINQLQEVYQKYLNAEIEFADNPAILENLSEPEIHVWDVEEVFVGDDHSNPFFRNTITPATKLSYTPDGVYLILES